MGFSTQMHQLSELMRNTRSGSIRLPDFQRHYKWEDERVRQLIITILRQHPLGIVMLLETGNSTLRFKPRPIEGTEATATEEPRFLLLDGQQRLTSLTQAFTGDGIVNTKDSRGKQYDRRYFIDVRKAVEDPFDLDEAVISVPADGVVRANFNRDIVLDLSTDEKQQEAEYFPVNYLLQQMNGMMWLKEVKDQSLVDPFVESIFRGVTEYRIPAIELDRHTEKTAVATVFEKVNVGGLPLNVFELLTAVFAGDVEYFEETGSDFRLNDDWLAIKKSWSEYEVLSVVENTDFLQAVTILTTRERGLNSASSRKSGISAKREDVLKLELEDYLRWRDPLRDAFVSAAIFLADLYIYRSKDVPYQKQLVPLALLYVVLGNDASKHSVKNRIKTWYWNGVLGEIYGSTIETQFVRDIETVPDWAREVSTTVPRTVQDATFAESRLHSMRTRNSAAYKGLAALIMANGACDWIEDKQFGAVQYKDLNVDIHHIFPKAWCNSNGITDEFRESIINKTTLGARTNRVIGGVAPSKYLQKVERESGLDSGAIADILKGHLINIDAMKSDDFNAFFEARRESLCQLVEAAMGKSVQRDVVAGNPDEDSSHFVADAMEE